MSKEGDMQETFKHTVLIIDDEEQIGKSIGRLLTKIWTPSDKNRGPLCLPALG